MVTNNVSSGRKMRKVIKIYMSKNAILGQKNQKTESREVTSALNKLLAIYFIFRNPKIYSCQNTSVNRRKCEYYGIINFNREKIQKCNIRWSQMTSPRVAILGKLSKKKSIEEIVF